MKISKALFVLLLLTMLSAKFTFAQNLTADTTRANAYYEMADSCLEARQLDSALFYAEKAQKLYIKHLGENSLKNSKCLHTIGLVNAYASKYDDALKYWLKKLEIELELHGENHTVANSYHNIGEIYSRKYEYEKALEYFFKSIKIDLEVTGESHTSVANSYNSIGSVYEKKSDFDKALEYYFKSLEIYQGLLGKKHSRIAGTYNNIGLVYKQNAEYDKALEYFFKSLEIDLETVGENHPFVATSYMNIGSVYRNKSEYDKALKYHFKSLKIKLEFFGEKHPSVADSYNNIGNVYRNRSEYDEALENHFKSLEIVLEIFGEKHPYVANSYSNIGTIYSEKSENDKALEYYFKSLEIRSKFLGEKHPSVAGSYNNIGLIYKQNAEYDKALEYFFKSLEIRLETFGENHPSVATSYNNIGIVYADKSEYDKALEYYFKGLEIFKENLSENHPSVATSYMNIGNAYAKNSEYGKALEYHMRGLEIKLEILGEKHSDIANSYNNIGNVYTDKSEYNKALEYYQKGAASCLRNFNDTANVASFPEISDYLDWNTLLQALRRKARIFAHHTKDLTDLEKLAGLELALRHYQACDSIISRARQEIVTQSDKLALGERANEVYKAAVTVCLKLADSAKVRGNIVLQDQYKQTAFYFSERNKSSVLLQALAGSEALNFAGIPDSLLQKEHDLSINIALYKRILAEQPDSAKEILFRDKLFKANQQYDNLIAALETQYPDYYELKYNEEPAGVGEIQELLDPETAMISYFTGDSTVTIFCITKNNLDIKVVPAIQNFADTIEYYRSGLIYTTSSAFEEMYKKYAYTFYNKFIPSQIDKKIQNLILIPDAALSMIPFETLLTGQAAEKEWKDLPYLIKQYNISYSYSGNLFYQTFSKESSTEIEVSDLNDWLALAPVFDDSNTAGLTMRTRELLREFDAELQDTIGTRGRLLDGEYISPLPGTESEVRSIFEELDNQGKRALVQFRKKANEDFVKSGSIKDYKFLHFATHGIVNMEKPELSGIFLAQDSTLNEDGILYQGEIYNLDLNADLTVLSACETGLGKIKKGEGLIGLTRALLYAGSKNIIVSLWKVADESTSDLMIDFYKHLLDEEQEIPEFSKALQQAKLNMIKEGKYAHPFYWSPFILIGK